MFGPRWEPAGGGSGAPTGATFRLWAPASPQVRLVTSARDHEMRAEADGWHTAHVSDAGPGLRYAFRLGSGQEVPDPASHFQPDDVHGRSELIAHDYPWRAQEWRGRPWEEAAILEVHVGTFTKEGTFRAAIERLDDVAAVGFTAIELMPLADFAGKRNWGYDGVLLYAPDSAYGRPEDLKALIDAAHERGLMVFLDVVYNHFGPEGNYINAYAPQFFTSAFHTPWGSAIDYAVPQVRAFAIENALHWIGHYRFDGLRLDAVHAIKAQGSPPILEELSRAVESYAARSGRIVHLVLENDDNVASLLKRDASEDGRYRAQWNDDYHHAWHVRLTGETGGYYSDYAENPAGAIARALAQGFIYQGEPSSHRGGEPRGEPSNGLPPRAFVNFLQNHDQIGNRALGERLTQLADAAAVDAALAITLLAPATPLMFMGEEWGTKRPFPFFCDFEGDLAEAVRKGRAAEFAAQFAKHGGASDLPDPLSPETTAAATLDWAEREQSPYRERLALVTKLLRLRQEHVVPLLGQMASGEATATYTEGLLLARWTLPDGRSLALAANLGDETLKAPGVPANVTWLWGGPPRERMPPWSVHWWLETA